MRAFTADHMRAGDTLTRVRVRARAGAAPNVLLCGYVRRATAPAAEAITEA
jgi:hypothetical protein